MTKKVPKKPYSVVTIPVYNWNDEHFLIGFLERMGYKVEKYRQTEARLVKPGRLFKTDDDD